MKRMGLVAALAALALAGCSQEEADTLEKAFENEIESAQVDVQVDFDTASGEDGRLTVRGPFQRNGDEKVESFDYEVAAELPGERPFEARVVSTGENAFVVFKGTTYEVGEQVMGQVNRERAGSAEDQVDDVEELEDLPGVDLKSWFPESDTEEAGEIDAEETTHVSGRLDVSRALSDFNALMKHPAFKACLEATGNEKLTKADIRQFDTLVSDPRFDLHVAKSDDKLRRLAGSIRFDAGREEGTAGFAFQYTNVDEPVEIAAPEGKTRPIEDLLDRWGIQTS